MLNKHSKIVLKTGEQRLLNFAEESEKTKSAGESAEAAAADSAGLFTIERAKNMADKIDKDTAALKKIAEDHKEEIEEIKGLITAYEVDKNDTKKQKVINAIRSAISTYIDKMRSLGGTIDNPKKIATNLKGQLNQYQKQIDELQKMLKEFGDDDEARLGELEKEFAGRYPKAKAQYADDLKEVKGISSRDLDKGDRGSESSDQNAKLKLFQAVGSSFRNMDVDLKVLQKSGYAFGKVEDWASNIVDNAEALHGTVKDVNLEATRTLSDLGSKAKDYIPLIGGNSSNSAKKTVDDAIAKQIEGKITRKELSDTYLNNVQELTEELHEWYTAINQSGLSSEQAQEHAKELVDGLRHMRDAMKKAETDKSIKPLKDSIGQERKEELNEIKQNLRDELDNIKRLKNDPNSSKTELKVQIRKKMDEYLGKAKEYTRKSGTLGIGWVTFLGNGDKVHFEDLIASAYLDAVKELSGYLPDSIASPVTEPGKPEQIEASDVPHGEEIDKLVTLTRKGTGRTEDENKEYENLKKEVLKGFNNERTAGQQKMEKYLKEKHNMRLNKTTGELVAQGPAPAAGSEATGQLQEAINKIPAEYKIFKDFLTAILAIVGPKLKVAQPKQPAQAVAKTEPISSDDPRIAALRKQIDELEVELKGLKTPAISVPAAPKIYELGGQTTTTTDPLDAQFAQLQQMQGELGQLEGQAQQTGQTADWMSQMMFPNGRHQVTCRNGQFCVPGMPMTLLKWRASMAGCNPASIQNGITMNGGAGAFSTPFSQEIFSNPTGIFNKMANNYELPVNCGNIAADPLNNQRHFNWSCRKLFS